MKYSRTLLLRLYAVTIKDHDMSEDVTTDNALGIAIDVSGSYILSVYFTLAFMAVKKIALFYRLTIFSTLLKIVVEL